MNRSTLLPGLAGRLARRLPDLTTVRAPYQAAVLRIGLAAVCLAFLLREWPHRHVLYGNRSPLSSDLARILVEEEHGLSVILWSDGQLWFETVYTLTVAAAVAVLLGWRTRTMSVLLMVGLLSLENRNSLVGDGGDNVLRIMVIYLVLTRCAEVWSLDARRERRRARDLERDTDGSQAGTGTARGSWAGFDLPGLALWALAVAPLVTLSGHHSTRGWAVALWILWAVHGVWYLADRWFPRHEARAVLDAAASMLHNSAMLVIAAQVCLIYATAGWYKIQGSRWQEGSALHYVLHLDYFAPWPALSGFLASQTLLVLALTYGTVIVQVAFPFTLAHRKLKNVLLAVMIMEHLGIAVVLGIPFLSLSMVVCDAVFLPTGLLVALGARCARIPLPVRVPAPRIADPATDRAPATTPS
ncbi:HTTM domain-containing protein [Streptomyces sp. CC208A]|uniref:HTTM domain-containing protein n=1 Tax=Streptomyces sp. CC208A TaxID=3044573 RepID=UPI0024A7B000|nr:HTTM domain-containing protein [Streptomyces sp. CC208A]